MKLLYSETLIIFNIFNYLLNHVFVHIVAKNLFSRVLLLFFGNKNEYIEFLNTETDFNLYNIRKSIYFIIFLKNFKSKF